MASRTAITIVMTIAVASYFWTFKKPPRLPFEREFELSVQAGRGELDEATKVVSWFIIFPIRPLPIWVTVVGGSAAGTPAYF